MSTPYLAWATAIGAAGCGRCRRRLTLTCAPVGLRSYSHSEEPRPRAML